jgi:hypothetical protein
MPKPVIPCHKMLTCTHGPRCAAPVHVWFGAPRPRPYQVGGSKDWVNATKRGKSGTAITGSVVSTVRFLAKGLAS